MTTRDESYPQDAAKGGWQDRFSQRLAEQRAHAKSWLDERRQRLATLEEELQRRAAQVADGWLAQPAQTGEPTGERVPPPIPDEVIQRQQALLDEVLRQLALLDEAQATHRVENQQLAELAATCRQQESQIGQLQQQFARREAELAEQEAALQQDRERLNEQREQLAAQSAALEERAEITRRQRREIARQLRSQKAELSAEAQRLRAETSLSASGQDAQLQVHLAEERAQRDRLEAQLTYREEQTAEMRDELKQLKRQIEERLEETVTLRQTLRALETSHSQVDEARTRLTAELTAARAEIQRQTEQAQHASAEAVRLAGELAALAQETDRRFTAEHQGQAAELDLRLAELVNQLERLSQERDHQQEQVLALKEAVQHHERATGDYEHRCRDLEDKLIKARQNAGGSTQEQEDLRRRFEMALADVRELKNRNKELSDQLAQAKASAACTSKSAASVSAAAGAAGMDWAERRRLMMEQLETDFDTSQPQQRRERLTVEGALNLTDQIVAEKDRLIVEKDRLIAEKDRELAELHHLLDNQAGAMGGVAVGAAAIGSLLDQDALIQHERDSLKDLRERLSKAEIDISVERAKLARDRAELEEKLQVFERDKAQHPDANGDANDARKTGPRGNWLARLGLKDKS